MRHGNSFQFHDLAQNPPAWPCRCWPSFHLYPRPFEWEWLQVPPPNCPTQQPFQAPPHLPGLANHLFQAPPAAGCFNEGYPPIAPSTTWAAGFASAPPPPFSSVLCPCQIQPSHLPSFRNVGVQFNGEISGSSPPSLSKEDRPDTSDPHILREPIESLCTHFSPAYQEPGYPTTLPPEKTSLLPSRSFPKRPQRECQLSHVTRRVRECWDNPSLSPALPFLRYHSTPDHLMGGTDTVVHSDLSHTRVYPNVMSRAWSASQGPNLSATR